MYGKEVIMNNGYWEVFKQTGNISDYLNYACTNEESQNNPKKEGERGGNTGNRDWDGVSRHASWRL